MYDDEWEPIMAAQSMEEKVNAFARLAKNRAEQQDKPTEDVVHSLTHDLYLLKHTTGDVLQELKDLQEAYSEAFYDGAANDHIMQYMTHDIKFDFWHDYVYLFLAAGLEWAVLQEVEDPVETSQ